MAEAAYAVDFEADPDDLTMIEEAEPLLATVKKLIGEEIESPD